MNRDEPTPIENEEARTTLQADRRVEEVAREQGQARNAGDHERPIGGAGMGGVRPGEGRAGPSARGRAQRRGDATQTWVHRDHPAAAASAALAKLRSRLRGRRRNELGACATPAEVVSWFGSAARGNMRVDSDIDLFVVRSDDVDADDPTWQGQAARLVSLVTRWTGNDARIFELAGSEVVMGLANEEPVLADIRDQGIPLDGPPSYLRLGVRSSEDRRPDV